MTCPVSQLRDPTHAGIPLSCEAPLALGPRQYARENRLDVVTYIVQHAGRRRAKPPQARLSCCPCHSCLQREIPDTRAVDCPAAQETPSRARARDSTRCPYAQTVHRVLPGRPGLNLPQHLPETAPPDYPRTDPCSGQSHRRTINSPACILPPRGGVSCAAVIATAFRAAVCGESPDQPFRDQAKIPQSGILRGGPVPAFV